jgi:hypothetical protein
MHRSPSPLAAARATRCEIERKTQTFRMRLSFGEQRQRQGIIPALTLFEYSLHNLAPFPAPGNYLLCTIDDGIQLSCVPAIVVDRAVGTRFSAFSCSMPAKLKESYDD